MTDERSDKTVTTALDKAVEGDGEVKGKERAEEQESAEENESTTTPAEDSTASTSPTPWQAIFSPQYNAYYFFNTETQQTTWENPLLPSASTSTSTSTPSPPQPEEPADVSSTTTTSTTSTYTSTYTALQAAALQAGIDPSLAHLDPTLLSSSLPTSSSTAFTAKFNARTGAFARPDARDPTHLSEHARATRMSEFYFDVGAWEKQLAEQGGSIKGGGGGAGAEEEEGRKRKRPSKKDLERFKEQKKQKKIAKTAWLRT
ncbi:hypothetical protein Hypma_001879 [Hypsizygus marmoreus]|uniref:WW domain-containing protein n=1 Tax=Hypsizygus marmoreus TaxID=39966 RepID=A0A369JEV7_HYPMA|nr:hypothetical protein Hypma_001879 [Hypsizygus marmoreus]